MPLLNNADRHCNFFITSLLLTDALTNLPFSPITVFIRL